jgi:uncharacterized membrane protein
MAITPALIVHVSAGSIGILSGAVALSVRKGGRLHRAAGNFFFMLTMATMARYLAALIPQRNNVGGGVFVFYLVGTAWMTVRRREGSAGLFEYSAILVALTVVVADLIFGLQEHGRRTTMPRLKRPRPNSSRPLSPSRLRMPFRV